VSPGAHNIWEIALHIAVWDEICVARLAGKKIMKTTGSAGDWPAVGRPTRKGWAAAQRRLRNAQKALVDATRKLSASAFEKKVAGWPWTYRLMIHGTLHHDLYHAGQIALLRRAVKNERGKIRP
jgi:hypothetical protein